jgi:hypothetical protein
MSYANYNFTSLVLITYKQTKVTILFKSNYDYRLILVFEFLFGSVASSWTKQNTKLSYTQSIIY